MVVRLIIFLLAFTAAALIPFYYFDLLHFTVGTFGFGWVFTTIFLRVLAGILLFVALKYLFGFWERTKKIKTWLVFTIGFIAGAGASFISPIYVGDYGYVEYRPIQIDVEALELSTFEKFQANDGYQLVAFFEPGCPHCMETCKKLGTNVKAGQKVPVVAFFPSSDEDREYFMKANNGEHLESYSISQRVFLNNAGISFPHTFLIDAEGKTVNHWVGDVINYSALDYLMDLE